MLLPYLTGFVFPYEIVVLLLERFGVPWHLIRLQNQVISSISLFSNGSPWRDPFELVVAEVVRALPCHRDDSAVLSMDHLQTTKSQQTAFLVCSASSIPCDCSCRCCRIELVSIPRTMESESCFLRNDKSPAPSEPSDCDLSCTMASR
jgi:hypothetical protein